MDNRMTIYPNIDMERTGRKLRFAIKTAGYDVRTIQEYLHLSCPQPIYRWFKGKILPSVDHLYMLSILLGLHMEELLVPRQKDFLSFSKELDKNPSAKRLLLYYNHLTNKAA
jgi:hypothetical protein